MSIVLRHCFIFSCWEISKNCDSSWDVTADQQARRSATPSVSRSSVSISRGEISRHVAQGEAKFVAAVTCQELQSQVFSGGERPGRLEQMLKFTLLPFVLPNSKYWLFTPDQHCSVTSGTHNGVIADKQLSRWRRSYFHSKQNFLSFCRRTSLPFELICFIRGEKYSGFLLSDDWLGSFPGVVCDLQHSGVLSWTSKSSVCFFFFFFKSVESGSEIEWEGVFCTFIRYDLWRVSPQRCALCSFMCSCVKPF